MSHQDRRDPLPADYQYPTHGVDCDCPPCRGRWVMPTDADGRPAAGVSFLVRGEWTPAGAVPWPSEPTAETPWGV